MATKETLLAALEEVQKHEEETGGELRDVCIAFSVQNDSGDCRVAWVSSNSPYYAILGLLSEVEAGIAEGAGDWVGDTEDDEED